MEQFTEIVDGKNEGQETVGHAAVYKLETAPEGFESSKKIGQFSSEHKINPDMTRSVNCTPG